uniref:Si:dkey-14o18.2 n=1 Tax=Scleropages formosus TaxID=113540 RepID=A0A8C9SCT0_SCLFO
MTEKSREVFQGFSLPPFLLSALISLAATSNLPHLPGVSYRYGQNSRLVCTPLPMDAEHECSPTGRAGHRTSRGGLHGNAWADMTDEAKTTILHLRESLVRQKETILDQRETIRELTAKLALCEEHQSARHPHFRGSTSTGDKHPRATPPDHIERTLRALKERLESLQARNTTSSYSSSLRDLLQRRILALEHQMNAYHASSHGTRMQNRVLNMFLPSSGSHQKPRSPEAFQIGFPMQTNYMHARVKRTIPSEMFAFTLCLWLKGGAGPGLGTPLSYSVPTEANELVLMEWGNNPMELLVNDKAVTLPISLTGGTWHHVCVTWSARDGLWEAFLDGMPKGSGEDLSAWHTIKPGGVFILGQEQDTMGGRFDATQAFVGEMSDVQLWSHVLTTREIYNLATCRNHVTGDIISWTETAVELHGGVTKYPFDPCY